MGHERNNLSERFWVFFEVNPKIVDCFSFLSYEMFSVSGSFPQIRFAQGTLEILSDVRISAYAFQNLDLGRMVISCYDSSLIRAFDLSF